MEYIIQDTNILDKDLDTKLKEILLNNISDFIKETSYKVSIKFNEDDLDSLRYKNFDIPVKNKLNEKDTLYEILHYQQNDRLSQTLNDVGITEVYNFCLEGNILDTENIIIVVIIEDTSKPNYTGKGKNRRRQKIISIMPSFNGFVSNVTRAFREMEEERNSDKTNPLQKGKPKIKNEKQAFSVADEILKFKSLMKKGIITKEEFETKKKQLLNIEN